MEISSYLAVTLCSSYSGRRNVANQLMNQAKTSGSCVEGITGEPYQLFLGKPDGAGVIELSAQLALVNHLGETT